MRVAIVMSLLLLHVPTAAWSQCTKDTDCKGDRICDKGRCIDRSPMVDTVHPEAVVSGMPFTEEHLAEMKSGGCPVDERMYALAEKMYKRGFTPENFALACREEQAMRRQYSEFHGFPRTMVETVAAAQKMKLDENDRYWLVWHRHNENLSITEAYNEKVVGGPRPKLAGWIVGATGAAIMIAGGIAYGASDSYRKGGLILIASGATVLVPGIICLAVGYVRTSRHLPPGTLDTGHVSKLRADREPAVRFTFTPTLGQNHAGLGVVGVW